MSLFDVLRNSAKNAVGEVVKDVAGSQAGNAASRATEKLMNSAAEGIRKNQQKGETVNFSFDSIPGTLAELQALKEAKMDTPYKTAALTILALNNYEKDKNVTFEMLEYLNGPDSVSNADKSFFDDRLIGKEYKVRSFFQGATPDNNYTPNKPYKLAVSSNANSFAEENWATIYVTSGGADAPRPIKLRKKPSTGQWFVVDIECLADIRIPKEQDAWA